MKYKNRTIKVFNSSYRILYVNDIKSENPDRTTMGETDFTSRTIRLEYWMGKDILYQDRNWKYVYYMNCFMQY